MKCFLFLLLSGLLSITAAQNILTLSSSTTNAGDTATVFISLTNTDTAVALQCDIQLPLSCNYILNSAFKGNRCGTQTLNAVMITDQILRIILYSQNRVSFSGNAGIVAGIRLTGGTVPGTYPLMLSNVSISNPRSVNILSSFVNGILTVMAPDISLSSVNQNFGSVPWYSNSFRTVTVRNNGNSPLAISRIYSTGRFFTVSGDTAFTLPPGATGSITILFHSLQKGLIKSKVFIESTDPDEPLKSIDVVATGFAVNELRPANINTRSGSIFDLPVSVNNMEKFTGLQFDLKLPKGISYSGDGAYLSQRSNSHSVSVSQLSPNTLRCVIFSSDNKAFYDSSGTLVTLRLRAFGTSAFRTIITDSVIISDSTGSNIVSSHFNSSVIFSSPDISGPTQINLGECSLIDSIRFPYPLQNVGNDTLIVTDARFTDRLFNVYGIFPTRLQMGSFLILTISFSPSTRGRFTSPLFIRSNDPDEDPFGVQFTGTAYAPNYLSVRDITAVQRDTLTLRLDMANYDPIVAFQTDIQFPAGFTYVQNSAVLSGRKTDHSLSVAELGGNKFRLFAYSVSGSRFSGNSGALMELKLISPSSPGAFAVALTNAILSDSASQNVLKSVTNGTISLLTNIEQFTNDSDASEELGFPFPNPFSQETRFTLKIKNDSNRLITIINSSGEIVRTFERSSSSGLTTIIWDGLDTTGKRLPGGVYYLTVSGSNVKARKIVLMK